MRSLRSVLLMAVVASGCSDPVGPENIAGKWAQDMSIPGNFWEMTLTLSGSTISGNGNWCGEAGPCGTFVVTGAVSGSNVHLDFVSMSQSPSVGPPFSSVTSRFDGRLTSPTTLRGSLTAETSGVPSSTVTYRRES
ncbi:MAG: hypothetical protein ACJ8AJ_10335 [Gemmatimonadaceae bacterium]